MSQWQKNIHKMLCKERKRKECPLHLPLLEIEQEPLHLHLIELESKHQ